MVVAEPEVEGDEVSVGDTVGLIEVMRNLEIKAEDDGKISKFLMEGEEAVEAGQNQVELE